MPYKYLLTPEILAGSKNTMVIDLKNKNGEFIWQHDPKMKVGWTDLLKDLGRNIKINHQVLEKEFMAILEENEAELMKEAKEITGGLPALTENIKALLAADLEEGEVEQVAALLQHYSQAPGIFVVGPPGYPFLNNEADLALVLSAPLGRDLSYDIYMEQSKIKIKVLVKRFPIVDFDMNTILYLEGPVEGLFELEPQKGFVLKHLATDSEWLAELYMGKFEKLFALLKKFQAIEANCIALQNSSEGDVVQKRHLNVILDALAEYRAGKLSYLRLIDRLNDQLKIIRELSSISLKHLLPLLEVLKELASETKSNFKKSQIRRTVDFQDENLAPQSQVPVFFFRKAKRSMVLVSETIFELASSFFYSEPNAMVGKIFGASNDHKKAAELMTLASSLIEDFNDQPGAPEMESLKKYLTFMTRYSELVKRLDKNSKLLAEINEKEVAAKIAKSITILLWGAKVDPKQLRLVEPAIGDYVDWMMVSLSAEGESFSKGKG